LKRCAVLTGLQAQRAPCAAQQLLPHPRALREAHDRADQLVQYTCSAHETDMKVNGER
jgi:hypothetical protein